jgi:predicted aspartyl protease
LSFAFHSSQGPIVVEASLSGPAGQADLRLILDTGATTSLIDRSIIASLGFDLAGATNHVPMTTGSGVVSVPRIVLTRLTSLGHHRFGFPVLAHSLPAGAQVFGLLGLDFLRGHKLRIDFLAGRVELT